MYWILAVALVLGVVDSAPAARTSRKSQHRSKTRGRVVSVRARVPVSPVRESLRIPRSGQSSDAANLGHLDVSAASAILLDANSGAVLYEWNPDLSLPPASVTKILTGLVILEHGRLQDSVVVSQTAAGTGGHRLGLRTGQRLSLGDLLAAILIRSANDAAVAAAEHVGGSLEGFVALMNATAKELGMTSSHFANPHGLDEPAHYTTARDMAILSRVALEHATFAELVRAREARLTIWKPSQRKPASQTRLVVSHNRLLGYLEGADGVKTGYTGSAGRCLVASASRGNRRMIAVLLNDPKRWTDAATLLEYGFGSVRDTAGVRLDDRPWHARRDVERPRLAAQMRSEEQP